MADIKEVARLAGVSVGTVSNAFNHPEKVSAETRKKIVSVAEEIGFVINQYASSLVTSQTKIIGVLLSYSYAGRHGNGIYEITKAAAERGYNILLAVADRDYEKEKEAVMTFIRYKVDGVIVYADYAEGMSEHFRKFANYHIPCVVFKRYDKNYDNIIVSVDNAFSSFIKQLKRYHHTELGLITINPYLHDGKEGIRVKRINELRQKLQGTGISFPEDNILIVKNESVDAGKDGVDEWLRLKENVPTVFLCFYDKVAMGVLDRLKDRGYMVPKDISVVAYGSGDGVIQYAKPKLANISVSEEAILKMALDILLNRIQNPDMELKDYEIDYRFNFHESLGMSRNAPQIKE